MTKSSLRAVRYPFFFVVAALVALLLSRPNSGPEQGQLAPRFDLPVVGSERRFALADVRGQPVFIQVFASWCRVCETMTPILAEAASRKRARPVAFLAVSVDSSAASAEQARTAWKIPYPVVHDDGRFARAYNVSLLPTYLLIDASGAVHRVASGPLNNDELERWFASVGAGCH